MNKNLSALIIDKFTKKFMVAYKELGIGKTKILKYSPILFKRWYYSALVSETTLSPSFIYNAGVGDSGAVSAPSVTPRLSGNYLREFGLKENRYSVNNHPVVKDLICLVNFCAPDIDLNEVNFINTESTDKISQFMSISDPFYVEYLTCLAFNLKLIKKSVAIYSNKATVSDNYMSFLELNQEAALKKIVKATVKLCAQNISEVLPQSISIVSEKGIIKLIKKPVPIDEIFKKIFISFGVDIEHVWDSYDETVGNVDESESAILSSTFFLGVIFDKWFITPFGEYLKIIEPIYCFSYNFEDELKYLLDVINAGGDVSTALFSPCAFYSFTPLGKLLFALETSEFERRNTINMPLTELMELLDMDGEAENINDNAGVFKETKVVFSFKVKLAEDKRCWKQIDAADYNTLHELHLEIAVNFGFSSTDYIFFTNETLSPFCKYVSPKSKGKLRKADKITLMELSLIKGSKMVYVANGGKRLEVELIKCLHINKNARYPQMVKQSKLMSKPE